jgi:hypothetical protein
VIALFLTLFLWFPHQAGYLSYAPLEKVVINRGWQNVDSRFDVLLGTQDCDDLARWAWVLVDGQILNGLVVDCSRPEDRQEMIERQLVADTNDKRLVHKWAMIILR